MTADKKDAENVAETSDALPQWGRVLIAGGTDWPFLGRKNGKNVENFDLPSPHILRDVAHEKMLRVFSGHSAAHVFFVNDQGDLFALGRNEHGQLGLPIKPTPTQDGGESQPLGGSSVHTVTRLSRQEHFVPPLPVNSEGDIVHVACSRNHTILCTRAGRVYAAGMNTSGQCGNAKMQGDLELFRRIDAAPFVKEKDAVIMLSAGLTFSLALTANGKLYAMGSSEKGQLGNGRTGEHFVTSTKLAFTTHSEPLLVRALSDKKIVQISSGQQHSVALDEDGYCYVWGFGGYGRLGLGTPDDQLAPVLVPQFARDNALMRGKQVIAGPSCTAVIDRQRSYWLTGKWKMTGDGGAGQGFMTYKYLPDLMGCRMQRASFGGVALLCVADEDPSLRGAHQATMNICWGQGANNGELGLGFDKPRSATKPLRCETLDNIAVLDVAGGVATTFYIARNLGEAYAELPSYPAAQQSQEVCLVCGQGGEGEGEGEENTLDESNALLECERCEEPWHTQCLDPPLSQIPEGEWHCPRCMDLVLDRSKVKTSTKATGGKGNGAGVGAKKRSAAIAGSSDDIETGSNKKSKAKA